MLTSGPYDVAVIIGVALIAAALVGTVVWRLIEGNRPH